MGDRYYQHTPAPAFCVPQGRLILTAIPAAAPRGLLNQFLDECGVLSVAGIYECELETIAFSNVDFELCPASVTGTFAPVAYRRTFRGVDMGTVVNGVNFVAATAQTVAMSGLRGVSKVVLRFALAGGLGVGDINFTGTASSYAEYHGL